MMSIIFMRFVIFFEPMGIRAEHDISPFDS